MPFPEHLGDDQAIGDQRAVFDANQGEGFFGGTIGGRAGRSMNPLRLIL